ncbi:MAG: PEP-CTERM sorting domain-containing protein [Isosphaeraceae bacterium]
MRRLLPVALLAVVGLLGQSRPCSAGQIDFTGISVYFDLGIIGTGDGSWGPDDLDSVEIDSVAVPGPGTLEFATFIDPMVQNASNKLLAPVSFTLKTSLGDLTVETTNTTIDSLDFSLSIVGKGTITASTLAGYNVGDDADVSITGLITSWNLNGTLFKFFQFAGDGKIVTPTSPPPSPTVPEPSSVALASTGAACLGVVSLRRRGRRRAG